MQPSESPVDAIARLRRRYVKSPRDRTILEYLAQVLLTDAAGELTLEPMLFGPVADARGIIVVARPGEGKSTLIDHGLNTVQIPDRSQATPRDGHGDATPAAPMMLRLVTPSPCTMKSLGLEVLKKAGYADVSERRERWSVWTIVRHRLALLQVRLVWFDEAQHILAEGSIAERQSALNAIKTLMGGENPCVVILSGIETLDLVRKIDPQIERRFYFLYPESMTGSKDRRRLKAILEEYCSLANLGAPLEADLIDRLLHGVDGCFGRAIEVMVDATCLAIRRQASRLDIQHFAECWAMSGGCPRSENVFIADKWASIATTSDKAADGIHAAERSRRKRGQAE